MILGELTDKEYAAAVHWLEEHRKVCPWASGDKYAGAIGGVLSWRIVNTSIGQLITLHCTCGEDYLANMDDL